jgi:hypothetical protein
MDVYENKSVGRSVRGSRKEEAGMAQNARKKGRVWFPTFLQKDRRILKRANSSELVRALRKQSHQNHQIRQAEQPLVSVCSRSFRGARDESQMAALGKIVDVIDANPGETCHFRIGEDFLARLDGYHGLAPGPRSLP